MSGGTGAFAGGAVSGIRCRHEEAAGCLSAWESGHEGGALRGGVVEDSQGAGAGVEHQSRPVVGGMQENERAKANLLGASRWKKAFASAKQEDAERAVVASTGQEQECAGG